jgi:hypothetical protein
MRDRTRLPPACPRWPAFAKSKDHSVSARRIMVYMIDETARHPDTAPTVQIRVGRLESLGC